MYTLLALYLYMHSTCTIYLHSTCTCTLHVHSTCTHSGVWTCIHSCTHSGVWTVYTHVHTQAFGHVRTHVWTCTHSSIWTCTHSCMDMYTIMYGHVHIRALVLALYMYTLHVHTQAFGHVYTHVHTHVHTQAFGQRSLQQSMLEPGTSDASKYYYCPHIDAVQERDMPPQCENVCKQDNGAYPCNSYDDMGTKTVSAR